MSPEILTTIVGIAAIASSIFCIHSGILYSRARKRLDTAVMSYMTMVEMQSEEMRRQSIASLSGDNIEMCGGCGGHFPKSTIDKCPGKTCENFKNILAERDAS